MADFQFDTDTTAYAYVSTEVRNYSEPYGHMRLNLRIPALRSYASGTIDITVSAQCSQPSEYNKGPEPFYALRTTASQHTDGLDAVACKKAGDYMVKLERAIERINVKAGAPAVLLEDYLMRVLIAAKVEHVFAPERTNDKSGGGIPDMPRYTPGTFSALRSQLAYLKRELLKQCGHFRESAAA